MYGWDVEDKKKYKKFTTLCCIIVEEQLYLQHERTVNRQKPNNMKNLFSLLLLVILTMMGLVAMAAGDVHGRVVNSRGEAVGYATVVAMVGRPSGGRYHERRAGPLLASGIEG